MINLTTGGKNYKIIPTHFPDGTSQVWKIPDLKVGGWADIEWFYREDSELLQVAQLVDLLKSFDKGLGIALYVPYLPYARQDKAISNETTFAGKTFIKLLTSLELSSIYVFDVHNEDLVINDKIYNIRNEEAGPSFNGLRDNYDVVVFPDKGAHNRYLSQFPKYTKTLTFEKVRDPSTGVIGSVQTKQNLKYYPDNTRFLIVDDICDGGGTFIPIVKTMNENGLFNVDLYVSHGIFSKGIDVLLDAGIKKIITTNSIDRKTPIISDKLEIINL